MEMRIDRPVPGAANGREAPPESLATGSPFPIVSRRWIEIGSSARGWRLYMPAAMWLAAFLLLASAALLLSANSSCGPIDDETLSVAGAPPETPLDDGSAGSDVPLRDPADGLSDDDSPAELLVEAARAGDAYCVRELLAGGVAPDSESGGQFAIHAAAGNGSVAALQLLVAAGAHLEALDQTGNSALTNAALLGNAEAVVVLLGAGADPNAYAEPNNLTPLKAILLGWTRGLSGRDPRFALKEEARYMAAWALIEAGGDPQLGPEGHPPPVVLAEGIGGAIGRLYAGKPSDPQSLPR